MPWRGPADDYPDEVPSLGWYVLNWIRRNLIVPDGPSAGQPLIFTREQARFVISYYAIDRKYWDIDFRAVNHGKFINARSVRRAILSRPKGWGKSPMLAALCLAEALADVVPNGWDENGEPVGISWANLGFMPKVQIVAVSEDQTANTFEPLLEMARNGPVAQNYEIRAMETFVDVPRGIIEYVTSSARSREGFRPCFAVADQTEAWLPSVGGPALAATIRRNLTKTGGTSIESPNAFIPGQGSVAEMSYKAWEMQEAGELKGDSGIMFDHNEAPPDTAMDDIESLRKGLVHVYGDSVWVDIDRVIADIYDPSADMSDSRRYFLNQITAASDAWVAYHEMAAIARADIVVPDKTMIAIGFDGSRGKQEGSRGNPDATALVAVTIDGGHIFPLGVWEAPTDLGLRAWRAPISEVEAAVAEAFKHYNVVAFYADPAKWEGQIAQWEATYGKKLKAKATRDHPIEWWVTNSANTSRIVNAVRSLHDAIEDAQCSYDGSSVLTRHFLNARRRPTRSGVTIAKEHPDSINKIDAAFASVIAWQARTDAILAGVLARRESNTFVPRRIR